MATAKPTGALVALDDSEREPIELYKKSQAELLRALESRQNQLFDPTLLAMAQGFLAPTKYGTFGESLGNVAGTVGAAQEAESRRAQEMAMLRMELAKQQLEESRKGRALSILQGARQGAPAAEGQPAEGGAAAQLPKNSYGIIPEDVIAQVERLDPALAKSARESNKSRMDQLKFLAGEVKTTEAGSYSVDPSGKTTFTPRPGAEGGKEFIPGIGEIAMSPDDLIRIRGARETLSQNPNDSAALREFYRIVDKYRGAPPPRPGAAGKPGEAPQGPMTPGQAELQKKVEEATAVTRATEGTKAEVTRTQQAIEAGSDATGRMAQYASLRTIAQRPDASQIFGILNRPDVASAILNVIQEGVSSRAASIQVGALEDALRNVGLKQDQIDQYRFALGTMANIQLQMAKLAQGQGAVSNFERELFASASISPRDNPQTILAKLSMLEERAKFDRAVASELRKSKTSFDEFVDTPKYADLSQGYLSRAASIASAFGAPARQSRPAAGAATSSEAARRLREELGIR